MLTWWSGLALVSWEFTVLGHWPSPCEPSGVCSDRHTPPMAKCCWWLAGLRPGSTDKVNPHAERDDTFKVKDLEEEHKKHWIIGWFQGNHLGKKSSRPVKKTAFAPQQKQSLGTIHPTCSLIMRAPSRFTGSRFVDNKSWPGEEIKNISPQFPTYIDQISQLYLT
jgi:hypothetical protein